MTSKTEMDEFTGKMITTFLLKDIRALARAKFGTVENMLANKARDKEIEAARNERNKAEDVVRLDHVSHILVSRGLSAEEVAGGTGHIWHHPYMRHHGGARVDDEMARVNAADKAEEYVFFNLYTDFTDILAQLRLTRVYISSKSKYKQDIELEERAYVMTTQGLVARAKGEGREVGELLEDLPAVVHAMARKAWLSKNAA